MASLPTPPFELDGEPLVTGSLEISNDRLVQGFSWLVAAVKEQNRVLGALGGQIDALQAGAASAGHPPPDGSTRPSMKEEMLVMQINAVRHEVSSLPRSSDLERQRERTMAEVADRQRESAERLQKELADVTETLCNQLNRIGEDVTSRLESLERRSQGLPARAAPSPAAAAVASPSQGQPPQDSGVPPPLPNPMSSSSIAAEDTEDPTDGVVASEGSGVGGARLAAELAALDVRITGRMDAAERQMQELHNQLQAVHQAVSSQRQAVASEASAARPASPAAPHRPASAEAGATPAAEAALPGPADATFPTAPIPTEVPTAAVLPEAPEANVPPKAAEAAEPQESAKSALDAEALIAAAVTAATEAATSVAAQASAEAVHKEQETVESFRKEFAQIRSQLELLEQRADSQTPAAEATQSLDANIASASAVTNPAATEAPQAQADEGRGADGAWASALQERLATVESSLKLVDEALPQLRAAVPHLESTVQRLQQTLGESMAQQAQQAQNAQQAPTGDAKVITRTERPETRGELPEPAPEDLATRHKDIALLTDEDVERLMARLQDVEEVQEKAERRLQQVQSRSREARSRSGSIGLMDRKGRGTPLTASKTSEAPSGGTVGGSWKDVQAELEHFRKLFEFIEGVLPRDAAEAMRFFNRRQTGKEEMSEMIADVFGPDVEFQNAKSQLESEFKMQTRELRREFDKLTLALKGLQRDVDSSGSKVVDLTRRTSQLETEVRTAPVAISSMEDPHQEPSPRGSGRRDSKDARDKAMQGMSQEMQRAMQELRDEIRGWIELFKASVVQALQSKPDHEQVADFVKQVMGAPAGESIALFAKRQLLGKCASCEAPIDADLMRVKRPQPFGPHEHWPPGDTLGAKVAIRPLNAGPPLSPSASIARLPKINVSDPRQHLPDAPKAKGMKSSASTPELRKDQEPPATENT